MAKAEKLGLSGDKLVDFIFVQAKKHAVISRSLLENSRGSAKKLNKLTLSDTEQARLFAKLYLGKRRLLKHRGVALIRENSKDWALVKEAVFLANQFCEEVGLSNHAGYNEYLDMFFMVSGKNPNLVKANSLHSLVVESYFAKKKIVDDSHRWDTKLAYDHYVTKVEKATGVTLNYMTQPTKYQVFVDVVDEARKMKLSPEQFIDAQFAAFDWKKAIPEVSQLAGEKAVERAVKYMYQNEIKPNEKKPVKIDFSKLKS